jgi:serine/threonine protein kinase
MVMAAAPSRSQFPHSLGGERLGRHEVLLRLGAGGMATVYLARAVAEGGFERLAALKVLHPHLLGEQEFLGMFLDEARVAARIHHPNVVAIQDLGVEENRMFTVMDYVLGDTLAAAQQAAIKLRRGLPLGIVLRVALDALRGLDAAHELVDVNGRSLNVVHRDATPHNILLGVDGVSRVTDFGIAKAESRISFTGVGTLKGKAPYMAPEQFANRRVDRRVDVFSMAITIWEALALRRCLPPDLAQPTRRPAYRPLATILREVPPELDAVISRGLRLNPEERWRTAGEFADAIERQLRDHVANHKAVATFVRAFASEKVAREREAIREAERRAQPTPRAIAALRGQSGFQTANPRATVVEGPANECEAPLRDDELEPPTRVMPPRPSRAPAARPATPWVPAPPSREKGDVTPAADPEPSPPGALRGGTLLGTGAAISRARPTPLVTGGTLRLQAPIEPESSRDSARPPPPESAAPSELPAAEPAQVFVSIPAPSIAPPALTAVAAGEPRTTTVLDPERTSNEPADEAPEHDPLVSLVDPEIPRAPRLPDVQVRVDPANADPDPADAPPAEAHASLDALIAEAVLSVASKAPEAPAPPPAAPRAPSVAPRAQEDTEVPAPRSAAWGAAVTAGVMTLAAVVWVMLSR